MKYACVTAALSAPLSPKARVIAGVRLRAIPGVVSAVAEEKAIRLWFRGKALNPGAERLLRRYQAEAAKAEPEKRVTLLADPKKREEKEKFFAPYVIENVIHATLKVEE